MSASGFPEGRCPEIMKVRLFLFVILISSLIGVAWLIQDQKLLNDLLQKKDLPLKTASLGLLVAFCLGTIHALSPGHGKALVAAYLVGERGATRHALILGGIVTFTHTISVFLLGFAMLFLSQYILPEKIVPWLSIISGVSIVLIGLFLFWKRLSEHIGWKLPHFPGGHTHSHEHNAGSASFSATGLTQGDGGLASLIALGVSGGLVPCPSALVLLLSAMAIDRTAFGILLLVAFSLGLASILIAIGLFVIHTRDLLPLNRDGAGNRFIAWVPILTAVFITGIGCVMTGVSLGIFRSPWN